MRKISTILMLLLSAVCLQRANASIDVAIDTLAKMNDVSMKYDKETDTYTFTTTGTDPYVYVKALSRDLLAGEYLFSFDYQCSSRIYDFTIYFGNKYTESRSRNFGVLPASSTNWSKFSLDFSEQIVPFDWGHAGETFRLDFGTSMDKVISIRNLRIESIKANIVGTISCSGVGMPNVYVSDGYQIVKTDSEGNYAMRSNKKNGYVFYEIPSGYMPRVSSLSGTTEQKIFVPFWKQLEYRFNLDKVETCDFNLKVENNTNFRMFVGADPQISNKSNDVVTFTTLFFPRSAQEITESGSIPIYSTYMGDIAWDNYWYSNNWAHGQYKSLLVNNYSRYKMPHFSVMGNHDHDGAIANSDSVDFVSSHAFRKEMGPNNYSYNIGKIHIVALDDIIYKNEDTGGSYATGIVGSRNYTEGFSAEVVEWLKKDLAKVDHDATVIICVHAPLYYISSINQTTVSYNRTRANEVEAALRPFKQVLIWSGHRHLTYNMNPGNMPNLMEHNINQIGGDLYAASYYSGLYFPSPQKVGRPVSIDGTPGGYQMFYFYGDSITWRYKGLEKDNDGQFHVYDGNSIKNFWKTDNTMKALCAASSSYSSYANLPDNVLIINVFNFDPKWKVEVFEGTSTKSLNVTPYLCRDIYHILAYDYCYYKKQNKLPSSITSNNYHSFMVTAKEATSDITVKVTDRFGNEYIRTIKRPQTVSLDGLAVGENAEKYIPTGLMKTIVDPVKETVKVVNGAIVIDAEKAGQAQITTIDGVKRMVNLIPGKNTVKVTEGMNIVTVNGTSTKVYVK